MKYEYNGKPTNNKGNINSVDLDLCLFYVNMAEKDTEKSMLRK